MPDGETRLARAGVADEDDVLLPFDEGEPREGSLIWALFTPGCLLEGEGLERPVPGDPRPFQPIEEALVLAVCLLLQQRRKRTSEAGVPSFSARWISSSMAAAMPFEP